MGQTEEQAFSLQQGGLQHDHLVLISVYSYHLSRMKATLRHEPHLTFNTFKMLLTLIRG